MCICKHVQEEAGWHLHIYICMYTHICRTMRVGTSCSVSPRPSHGRTAVLTCARSTPHPPTLTLTLVPTSTLTHSLAPTLTLTLHPWTRCEFDYLSDNFSKLSR